MRPSPDAPLAARARVCCASLLVLLALAPALAVTAVAAPPGPTPGSLELLGSFVTPTSTAVAPWKFLTLVGTTRGLLVEDLREPAAMTTLTDLPLRAAVRTLEVAGDSVMCVLADDTRALIDLAAIDGPREVALPDGYDLPNLRVSGVPYRVTVAADTLRVARWDGAAFAPVGAVALPGLARALVVDQLVATAYVMTLEASPGGFAFPVEYRPIEAVSLIDPAHPQLVGRFEPVVYDLPGYWRQVESYAAIQAHGGVLCLLSDNRRIVRCVDFRNVAQPTTSNPVPAGPVVDCKGLEVDGDRAVVWGRMAPYGPADAAFRVINIADPAAIRPHADYQTTSWGINGLALQSGRVAAVSDGPLRLLQFTATPAEVVDWGPAWYYLDGYALALSREAVYFVDTGTDLRLAMVDISDPAVPHLRGVAPLGAPLVFPDFAELVSGALYFARPGIGVGLVDVGDPFAPRIQGMWHTVGGQFNDLQFDGDRMVAAQEDGLAIYDVSTPLTPRFLGRRAAGVGCLWAAAKGDLAVGGFAAPEPTSFPSTRVDTLVTLSLADPTAPVELGRTTLWGASQNGGFLSGDLAYTRYADEDGAYERTATVADPAHPVPIYSWLGSVNEVRPQTFGTTYASLPKRPRELLGLHAVSNTDTLAIYDLRHDPQNPPLIARWVAPARINAWNVSGDRLAVLTSGRLDILRLRPDAIAPTLALVVQPDPRGATRLVALLTASEALDPKSVHLTVGADTLAIDPELEPAWGAIVPAALHGRITVRAMAADAAGNAASDTFTCAVGSADARGGALADAALGISVTVPPGAFAGPVQLLLVPEAAAPPAKRRAANDLAPIDFRLEPAALTPARPLTIAFAAAPAASPRLQAWTGTDYADLEVRIDRGTGTARAQVTQLGRFRLLRDAAPPAIVRTALLGAAPNPFNARTNVAFALAREGDVRLRIYDARGRVVRTLWRGALPAGTHGVDWDGRDDGGRTVSSGLYVFRLEADGGDQAARCMLVK